MENWIASRFASHDNCLQNHPIILEAIFHSVTSKFSFLLSSSLIHHVKIRCTCSIVIKCYVLFAFMAALWFVWWSGFTRCWTVICSCTKMLLLARLRIRRNLRSEKGIMIFKIRQFHNRIIRSEGISVNKINDPSPSRREEHDFCRYILVREFVPRRLVNRTYTSGPGCSKPGY